MRSDDKARFQRNLRTDRNSSWADANARVDRPNWDKVRIVCVVRRAVVRWKVHDGNGYAGVLRRRVVGMVDDLAKRAVRSIRQSFGERNSIFSGTQDI